MCDQLELECCIHYGLYSQTAVSWCTGLKSAVLRPNLFTSTLCVYLWEKLKSVVFNFEKTISVRFFANIVDQIDALKHEEDYDRT